MAKWHPASGKWGILGETQGSKQARSNKRRIDEMTRTLEGRGPEIRQFYSEMGDINERVRENRRLTELDKFLNSSYSINQVKKNIPITAKITCAINLNLDEIPDEFPFLIFLKSSKAPSNPKDKTMYKQNII